MAKSGLITKDLQVSEQLSSELDLTPLPTFTPSSELVGLTDSTIENLLKGNMGGTYGTPPTAPTLKEVKPVSLGTELTTQELSAREEFKQQVRDSLAARGLSTSAAGAGVESKEIGRFTENIMENRFQKERLLTQEAIALENQRFGEESSIYQLKQQEMQRKLQEVQLGLNAAGVKYNQELSTFTANLGSIFQSNSEAIKLISLVQQNRMQEADLELRKRQISSSKRSALLGGIGKLVGTVGGGVLGFMASGGNPMGAMAGASIGGSVFGGGGTIPVDSGMFGSGNVTQDTANYTPQQMGVWNDLGITPPGM